MIYLRRPIVIVAVCFIFAALFLAVRVSAYQGHMWAALNAVPQTKDQRVAAVPTQSGQLYATVRRYVGVTNPSEAARRVNEGFVPLVSQIPGFVDYYWIDAGGGVMISVSVFQSRASAEQSNKIAADFARKNLASVLPSKPQITAGEVVAHKTK